MLFPTGYKEIIKKMNAIDAIAYSKSRNFITGAVTYLSPYISRGVISTRQVAAVIEDKGYTKEQSEKLIQELAWRDYFQRVWQHLEDDMFEDIRHRYTGVQHRSMPAAIINANTGIDVIDKGIITLFETGYMHNHLRMYTASITCNIARANWQLPAQWMYYHLLDGDLASNTCSWQWVAGSFSSKQYYCNQENINKYTSSKQTGTFLDTSYEALPNIEIPSILKETTALKLETKLPEKVIPVIDMSLPLLIYTSYNLDPIWKQDINANRILLLEPSHFKRFPVSEKVISFILSLVKNIKGIQVFAGELNEIPFLSKLPAVYSKEHPLTTHFPGSKEERDWLFPEVTGFHNSFFSYWKKCLRYRNEKLLQ
jgi:deoxyribodipyrimidine photo-lyase